MWSSGENHVSRTGGADLINLILFLQAPLTCPCVCALSDTLRSSSNSITFSAASPDIEGAYSSDSDILVFLSSCLLVFLYFFFLARSVRMGGEVDGEVDGEVVVRTVGAESGLLSGSRTIWPHVLLG